MKKYFLMLLCLFAAVVIHAQETTVDSTEIYKYTDLTKQQVEELENVNSTWQKQMNVVGNRTGYLMLMAQQQSAVDKIVKPDQRKKYQYYKRMQDQTSWIKQNVSLSKEQQEKMALVCFATYDQLDNISGNKTMNDEEKKYNVGNCFPICQIK